MDNNIYTFMNRSIYSRASNAVLSGTIYSQVLILGLPVSGASIIVFDMNSNVVGYAVSSLTGTYQVTGLNENQSYSMVVSKLAFVTSTPYTFIASAANTRNVALQTNILSTDNSISGSIKDQFGNNLTMATVFLLNSSTKKILVATGSISNGIYYIYNIPAGTYMLNALKQNYLGSGLINITLTTSQARTQNITLEYSNNLNNGMIQGIIKNSSNSNVSNAFVGLYTLSSTEVPETMIDYTFTNNQGKYIFGNKVSGRYKIKSKLQ